MTDQPNEISDDEPREDALYIAWTAVGVLAQHFAPVLSPPSTGQFNQASAVVSLLRAAAGCAPDQPLVILPSGELTTAEASLKWHRDTLFRIPGAEEAQPND